jgi:hypothetical protein
MVQPKRNIMYPAKHIAFIMLIILTVILHSCRPKEKIAPDFPPVESLSVDLSFFENPSVENSTFDYAKSLVIEWANIVNDSIEFYTNIYDIIIENQLEFQTEDTWLYAFDEDFGTDTNYHVKYFEIIDADTVLTKMFISAYSDRDSIYFTEILGMDGTMISNQSGEWKINTVDTTVLKTQEYLEIIWRFIDDKSDFKTKIVYKFPGEKTNNSIFRKDSVDASYSSYIELEFPAESRTAIIQWDPVSKVGRLKDYNFKNDDNWYCWDESLSDIICN